MSVDVDHRGKSPALSPAAIHSVETGPTIHPGFVDAGRAFGRLGAIPRVCPPQRPCVGRWWWLCFMQHGVAMCVTSPLVIPPDGGLYHGYHPVTLGWCFFPLRVWQWLALVTITIRTSFLIHLVQKVCELEIGRRLILPLPLLSGCAIYFTALNPFLSTLVLLRHINCSVLFTLWYLNACTDSSQLQSLLAGPLATVSHHCSPGELERKKATLWASVVPPFTPCVFLPSSPYFHWEEHWPHLWGQ